MWIKRLHATFGSLDNKTLELREGLNIVYGQNEAGKSTWSAFIRAMLYGISTREKAKLGFIPDKERYLPWNGNPMYGRMELYKNGDELEIERTAGKTGVFSKVSARNISRGTDAPLGDELVGVARDIYDRCAFIGQARLNVTGDKETEKKILSLSSTGDESVSIGEVTGRLSAKQRELRSPRGLGALPELEASIEELLQEIDIVKKTEEEISLAEESLQANARMEEHLVRDLAISEAEENKKARQFVLDAEKDLEAKTAELSEYENYPTREAYEKFRGDREQWQARRTEYNDALKHESEAQRELEDAKTELCLYPAFEGMTEERAEELTEADMQRIARAKSSKPGKVTILMAILAAVSGAISFLFVPAALLCAVFIIAFVILLLRGNSARKRERAELCARYGECSEPACARYKEGFCNAGRRLSFAADALNEARVLTATAERALEMSETALRSYLALYNITQEDIMLGERVLRDMAEKREGARLAVNDARIRIDAIEKTATKELGAVEYLEHEIPGETGAEIRAKLESVKLAGKNTEMRLAALRERVSGHNREASENKLAELQDTRKSLTLRFEAYDLAIKTITAADTELKNRFSPEIEARAGEIFKELTGGSFEVVRIKNREFDMEVATGVASARRDELLLSQGTLDELYLSLRMALSEMILPEDEAPPVILDDAFVNFDDERMSRALELLMLMAKDRQIIIFSCHTREAKAMQGRANIVRI